jgi:iron complex outermembrane receptor protein
LIKTKKSLKYFLLILLTSILHSHNVFAQEKGSISGVVKHADTDEGIPFVNVFIVGTSTGVATGDNGFYKIPAIDPGEYILRVSAVGHVTQEINIVINSGSELKRDFYLKNSTIEFNDVYVYGASLRKERITESPSSITVLGVEEIQRNSGHGQLAKLLENETGVDIAQNGLFDFNINTRGFNSSLNRRLLILLDGRDLGTAFLGATEWNGLSIPLEELGRIELVRGPGSALYGANAFNGVINISSTMPRQSNGTRATVGGGEMNAIRGDVSHAGTQGKWSYRLNLGGYQGDGFSTDRRNRNFEYEGLNPFLNNEVAELNTDAVRTLYASGRVDYEYAGGRIVTLEGGIAQVENEVIVTGIGRVQVQKAQRPWGRFNYNGDGFNILLWTNIRNNIEPEKSLSTGLDLIQDASISHGEIQYNFSALEDHLFVVAGASHRLISIDTKKTLMKDKRNDNTSGIFAQLEYKFLQNLKGVVAARWDRSSLHPSEFSPKLALVWTFIDNHSLRITFNKAFQPPNYSEQYLYVLHPTSALAYIGNPNLTPEKITGYELGYKGVISNVLFITTDFYYNKLKNFVTDLGPGVNPDYPDPIILPDDPQQRTRNIWSYANAGKVEEYGTELGLNYYISEFWLVDANVSYFKFDVKEQNSNDIVLPNTPEYKFNVGLTYTHPEGHSVSAKLKYVPEFPWAAGIFRGEIKSYSIINLSGTYRISRRFSVNLNVSNLLNNKHYEIFGGSVLQRRALASLIISL